MTRSDRAALLSVARVSAPFAFLTGAVSLLTGADVLTVAAVIATLWTFDRGEVQQGVC